MSEVLSIGAWELADLIKRRRLSPVEVVHAHIARIEEVNPRLNAVVVERFDAACDEARSAEEALASGTRPGPLHGVPFTVKEIISVKGMPFTCGSTLRRHRLADADATVVGRLRQAGAILLGLTNLPEMAYWMETANCVYGRTNNPYDLRRTPGGSSGGEAAIVAAGGSAFGVGSDGAGSIRMPALFCGLFGHKPTAGLVPVQGHFPFFDEADECSGCITIGPLTRRASDLMPLLRVMSGADPHANAAAKLSDFHGRTVLVMSDPRLRWTSRASAEMRQVTAEAAVLLEEHGAHVTEWSHPSVEDAFDIWTSTLQEAFGLILEQMIGAGRRMSLAAELLRWSVGRPRHTLPALLFCLGERLHRLSGRASRNFTETGRRLRDDLEQALGNGVLIMPPHPRAAPRHGAALLRPLDWVYTCLWNALGLPVTSVPLGRSRLGLPLGIQVIAARGGDDTTIAVANLLEDAMRAERAPSKPPLPLQGEGWGEGRASAVKSAPGKRGACGARTLPSGASLRSAPATQETFSLSQFALCPRIP